MPPRKDKPRFPAPDGMMTTEQFAKALELSMQTVRNYAKDSRFPSPTRKRRGKQVYYLWPKDYVEKYMNILDEIATGKK